MPRRPLFLASVAAGCAAVLGPACLQWAGVLAPSYAFAGGALTVLPVAAASSAVPTTVWLVVSSVGAIIIPATMGAQTRAALTDAERRLRLQAWHLRQMVPAEPSGH